MPLSRPDFATTPAHTDGGHAAPGFEFPDTPSTTALLRPIARSFKLPAMEAISQFPALRSIPTRT